MLPSLLTLGSRWTLVGGKGGVGKTTTAAALAVALADAGEEVLVLSVDPAHSLGDALEVEVGPEPVPVPGVPRLRALEVDAERERRRFLEGNRGRLLRLIERGTYLDREDAAGIVELAVPGMDELAALLRLLELAAGAGPRVVLDTAPTGHTLRLLELPRLARGWLGALEAMEDKHRAVAAALAGGATEDDVSRLLASLDGDLGRLERLLHDPERTRLLLVTAPGEVVLAETRRYRDELERRGIAVGGVVVNRRAGRVEPGALGAGIAFVPPLDPEPRGVEGLRRFAAAARPAPAAAPPPTAPPSASALRVLEPWSPPPDRALYLVGGKGGVGKSTTAAALAVRLAERRGPTLLLGTDPAGSLGEVLGAPVGPEAAPVAGAPGLWARQVDAPAVWERFRAEYLADTERLFSGLLGGGASAAADRRVVERLVDLAPPGVDELVSLLEVVDLLEDRPYDAVVLDTAPTGHLLRLLEMPEVVQEWTRALLRLLLKYREAIGLGDLAERVLRLARSLRALRARLADPEHTWALAVALPEALSLPETRRLLARLRGLGIEPGALLVNRLLRPEGGVRPERERAAAALVALDAGLAAAGAPEWSGEPAGPAALRALAEGWRRIEPTAPPAGAERG